MAVIRATVLGPDRRVPTSLVASPRHGLALNATVSSLLPGQGVSGCELYITVGEEKRRSGKCSARESRMWHVADGEGAGGVPLLWRGRRCSQGYLRWRFSAEKLLVVRASRSRRWRLPLPGAGGLGCVPAPAPARGSVGGRGGGCPFQHPVIAFDGGGWAVARCLLGEMREPEAASVPHREGFHGTHPDGAISALAAWPHSSGNNATHGLFNPSRAVSTSRVSSSSSL